MNDNAPISGLSSAPPARQWPSLAALVDRMPWDTLLLGTGVLLLLEWLFPFLTR
ncbi:MAG: hypothetical protein AB7K67_00960 [Hyphomicrobiaceae bacterium]